MTIFMTTIATSEILNLCITNDINEILYNNTLTTENFQKERKTIQDILNSTEIIVGYDVEKELNALKKLGLEFNKIAKSVKDKFAPIYGEWDRKSQRFCVPEFEHCILYCGVANCHTDFETIIGRTKALNKCWNCLRHELCTE